MTYAVGYRFTRGLDHYEVLAYTVDGRYIVGDVTYTLGFRKINSSFIANEGFIR